jgi:diguanylate cyclase (GGDEF)-like protein
VARVVAEDRRQVDVVARYGGEEFAIILHDATHAIAADVAEKIRTSVSAASIAHADKQPLGKMTVSIGVACCPDDATTAEGLLEAADVALYRAKKSGRDCVVIAGRR